MGTENNKKIILDLCGGTGSWSKPYEKEGYIVYNITLPKYDVRKTKMTEDEIIFRKDTNDNYRLRVLKKDIYGILAAPPCDQFSFARTKAKNPRDLRSGMEIVVACLKIIWECQYGLNKDTQKYSPLRFWALENPYYSMLCWFLGEPKMVFDPYEFGDAYQKKTALWGYFNEPKRNTEKKQFTKFDYLRTKEIHPEYYGKLTRTERRAITPKGFAEAFFRANK